MHDEIRILRTLIAVFDQGSVVQAGRALGYSPAAISRQLSALQRELGIRLFTPSGRGIRPTDEATEVVSRARRVVAHADEFNTYFNGLRAGTLGVARLPGVRAAGGPYQSRDVPIADWTPGADNRT